MHYSNATWDNLIDILDKENPNAHVKDFSEVWVKQKGMPYISSKIENNSLVINQTDIYKRGLCWRQRFQMGLVYPDSIQTVNINMQTNSATIPLKRLPIAIIPNYNGEGYGVFSTDNASMNYQLQHWMDLKSDLSREAVLMNIYENYQQRRIDAESCSQSLLKGLAIEKNALIASSCCSYLASVVRYLTGTTRSSMEKDIWTMSRKHPIISCRQKLLRSLFDLSSDSSVIDSLYNIWKNQSEKLLNEDDYMSLSYQLAIKRPNGQWRDYISTQENRLTSIDRKREYEYVSRACTPDKEEQYKLFQSLLKKENRTIEPWTQKLLALLNNSYREPYSNKYITPGLNVLQEIQKTGDIFFPKGWLSSLLYGHKSKEAKDLVTDFLKKHPDYPYSLKNKLLQAAYELRVENF